MSAGRVKDWGPRRNIEQYSGILNPSLVLFVFHTTPTGQFLYEMSFSRVKPYTMERFRDIFKNKCFVEKSSLSFENDLDMYSASKAHCV